MIRRYLLPFAVGTGLTALVGAGWSASLPENDWKIAGPFGGTATSIALDPENPKTVLAGGRNSLLFKSDDAGATWGLLNFPKRNFGEVTSLLVDPDNSQHYLAGILASDRPGIYESYDAGKTWAAVKDIDVGVRALAVSASNPKRFVAGTLRGVMLSDDAGKTWTRISDPQNLEMQGITAVAIDSKDPNIIYAGTPHLPWRTTDGGKTWSSIHTGMIDDSDVFSIYIDPSKPSDIFASACSGIYASLDRGNDWRKLMGIPNGSRRTHVVRQDPVAPETIFAGTTLGLFKTENAGKTWKPLSTNQVNSMVFDPAAPKQVYMAMEYAGIGKSTDGGNTILPINNGFIDRRIAAVTVSGSKLVAIETGVGDTTGVYVSKDQGNSWEQLPNARGLGGVHLNTIVGTENDPQVLLAASPHQMYKSADGGSSWRPVPIRLAITEQPKPAPMRTIYVRRKGKMVRTRVPGRPVKPRVIIHEISPSSITKLAAITQNGKPVLFAATDLGLLRSDDMGGQWTRVELTGSTGASGFYSAPSDNGFLVARGTAGLYLSKDFGEHWEQLMFPKSPSEINDVALPDDNKSPLLVAAASGLFRSTDGGATWSQITNGLPSSTFNSVTYNPGNSSSVYAVEYGQLFKSEDAGSSWSAVPSSIPALWIRQLWMPNKSSGRLYGITNDLGILFRN